MADLTVSSDIDTFMQAANAAAMRTALGLGTIATQASNSVSITGGSISGLTSLSVVGSIEQRNGTTALNHIIYGTYTSGSEYARVSISASSTSVIIASQGAGTYAINVPLILRGENGVYLRGYDNNDLLSIGGQSPDTVVNILNSALVFTGNGKTATFANEWNLSFSTTTGTKIGTATTQKLAFWNATPVVQQTRPGQLSDSSGGSSGGNTISALTDSSTAGSADLGPARDAIATLAAKINAIEALLATIGLISS